MSKDLFQLIKSLSPTEKRYFKVNAVGGNGSKNYISLFNVIDKMEIYDEHQVRKKLKDKRFLENLHVNKNYLYQVILRTLRSYYEKKSADLRLHNLLIDANILNQKGQYAQAGKLLQKVKKLALKYDNQMLLLAALRQEINLAFTNPRKIGDEITGLSQQLADHLELFEYEIQLYILRSRLIADQRAHFTLQNSEFGQNLTTNPLLKKPPSPPNFHNSILFHRTWAVFYHMSNERKQAFEHYRRIVEIWEEHDHLIKDKPYLFKIQLSNYLCICHELSEYKDFEHTLARFKAIPSKSFDEEAETFQNVAYYELLYYMNTLRFEAASALIPDIEKGLKRYARKVNKARQLAFWYNISILFFALGDYKKALDWLANILNSPKTEHRQDIQYFARFLELIFHFELKNLEVYDYLLRSLLRFANQKRTVLSAFESLLLDCFKKVPSLIDQKDSRVFFTDFKKRLYALSSEERKQPIFEEVLIWVSTKLNGLSFREVMQEKYGSNKN